MLHDQTALKGFCSDLDLDWLHSHSWNGYFMRSLKGLVAFLVFTVSPFYNLRTPVFSQNLHLNKNKNDWPCVWFWPSGSKLYIRLHFSCRPRILILHLKVREGRDTPMEGTDIRLCFLQDEVFAWDVCLCAATSLDYVVSFCDKAKF